MMTDKELYRITGKVLNNEKLLNSELFNLCFYKVEQNEKYYDVLACALYQLGAWRECFNWKDYLTYSHFELLEDFTSELNNRHENKSKSKKDYTFTISDDVADALIYALIIYKSVLMTIHKDKIMGQIKEIIEKMREEKEENNE